MLAEPRAAEEIAQDLAIVAARIGQLGQRVEETFLVARLVAVLATKVAILRRQPRQDVLRAANGGQQQLEAGSCGLPRPQKDELMAMANDHEGAPLRGCRLQGLRRLGKA